MSLRTGVSFISALKPNFTPAGVLLRTFHSSRTVQRHYENVTTKEFEQRVLKPSPEEASKPILVDFYADWCGPCHALSPILVKLTSDASLTNGKELDLMTVDTDREVELAQKYRITSLPTVIAFRDGKTVGQIIGARPMEQLQKFVSTI